MRTVAPETYDAITGPTLRPTYLVALYIGGWIYHSTRDQVEWNDIVWHDTGIVVERVAHDQASILLPDTDHAYTQLIWLHGIAGQPITIYRVEGDGPFAADRGHELFSGVMDTSKRVNKYLQTRITCRPGGGVSSVSPSDVIAPPVCNHMPAPGSRFDNYILEARGG